MNIKEQCESALQLLLKLSNKPHFFYVDEVKEIATIIHTLGNSLQSSKGISDEEIKNAFKNFAFTNDDNEQIMELDEFEEAIKSLRSKLSEGSKTNGIPNWYTADEIYDWLIKDNYSKEIAETLSKVWANDLQKAFIKGWQKRGNDLSLPSNELSATEWDKTPMSLDIELSNQTDAVESDAILFAEWLCENNFEKIANGKWRRKNEDWLSAKDFILSELYLIFQKEKEKQDGK